jgi:hypothetical protein
MYTSVDFISQIAARRGSLVPQTRGSHTPNMVFGLVVTLKIDYYYLLLDYLRSGMGTRVYKC